MSEHLKDALTTLWQMLAVLVIGLVILAMALLANKQFGTPAEESFRHGLSHLEITVAKSGDSTYTFLSNVSEEVREEVKGVVYPSPEAAEDATTSSLQEAAQPRTRVPGWLASGMEYFGIKPAEAHAVKICTHSKNGVASNFTGVGRHVTWFRGHWGGAHHTRTVHQVLSNGYWTTYATYDYAVARSYCGC
jgi:hypothetical protein